MPTRPEPSRERGLLASTIVSGGLLLALAALAEALGAPAAAFYLLLAGVPVSAVGGLAAFGRLVDRREGEPPARRERLRSGLAAALVPVFCAGAATRSPVLLEAGPPALAGATLAAGFSLVVCLALAAAVPARR